MATAVPLPNGMTQFIDANGAPYASGQVIHYIPGTATAKTTWQDPTQTTPNTDPITLDAAGRATIWGSGIYRQQLWDVNGNLIWDRLTEAADANYIIAQLGSFTGDSGAGGAAGLVPAPPAGSAAAGDYLKANGNWGPLLVVVPASPDPTQAGLLFLPKRTITTATNSLLLTDAGGCIINNFASPGTLTIPNDSTVSWLTSVVTGILICNLSTSGVVTLARGSGVSLLAPGITNTSGNRSLAAGAMVTLYRIGANLWNVVGGGLS